MQYAHLFFVFSCICARSHAFMLFLILILILLYHSILSDIHLLLHFIFKCSTVAKYFVFSLVMSILFSIIFDVGMGLLMLTLAILMSCLNFFRSLSCGLNLNFLFSSSLILPPL